MERLIFVYHNTEKKKILINICPFNNIKKLNLVLIRHFLLIVFYFITLISNANSYQRFGRNEGLPSVETYKIIQDHEGYIWVGTDRGLSKYDGYKFENFSTKEGLPSNVITDLFVASDSSIWLNLRHYQPCYIKNNIVYQIPLNNSQITKLKAWTILKIQEEKKDTITIVYKNGLVFEYSMKSGSFYQIYADYESRLDYVSRCFFINTVLENNSKSVKPLNQNPSFFKDKVIRNYINVENNIVFSLNKDSALYIIKNDTIKKLIDLPSESTSKYGYDNVGNFWVGLFENGVIVFEKGNLNVKPNHYLQKYSVTSRLIDREGNAWYSTLANGIFFTPNERVESFSTDILGIGDIKSFIGLENKIYLSSERGKLIEFNKALGKSFFSNRINRVITFPENKLILSSQSMLKSFVWNPMKEEVEVEIPIAVHCLKVLNDKYYVSSRKRFYVFDKLNSTKEPLDEIKLDVFINTIESFNNEIILGTYRGMYIYNKGKLTRLDLTDSLFQPRISSIVKLSNEFLAVATLGSGLFILNKDKQIANWINNKNGLTTDLLNGLFYSSDSVLYSFGNNGYTVYQSVHDSLAFTLKNIEKSDGLGWHDVIGIHQLNDTFWVASRNGITKIVSAIGMPPQTKPSIININIHVNNHLKSDRQLRKLTHDENNLSVGFLGISYRSNGNIFYEYRFKELNDKWLKTNNTSIELPNLNYGHYTFQVRVQDYWGQRSEIISKTIIISPPFWKEIWFILFLFAFFTTLIFLSIKWKIKTTTKKAQLILDNYRAKNQVLNAQLNPHFIFNNLSSINNYLKSNNTQLSAKYLKGFAKLMRETLENSKSQLVTLEIEVKNLKEFSRLEQLNKPDSFKIKWEIDTSIDLRRTFIPPMLLQPALENSIKYSSIKKDGPIRIIISVKKEGNYFDMKVEDNGVGRNSDFIKKASSNHVSSGLSIIKSRVDLFNHMFSPSMAFEIVDLNELNKNTCGTLVLVKVPLKTRLKTQQELIKE
tara:strand:+ start:284 stop:3262 length:2979 start_codon:yes stop_codon:yes gene_type:complete